ncbi:MAG: hypothetical protein Terrestrivirus1_303 [Terrestrivirus sp.]|uniref:F-box domain-containing protein n=1 Tax=Terrestrivirus sp. TaxID=2487775 RepID=A0A3G4ZPR0_9VIRU|nr:MAG: hypothetical protein Terrestrivirus1_303 [Terrestrivirus sp.]
MDRYDSEDLAFQMDTLLANKSKIKSNKSKYKKRLIANNQNNRSNKNTNRINNNSLGFTILKNDDLMKCVIEYLSINDYMNIAFTCKELYSYYLSNDTLKYLLFNKLKEKIMVNILEDDSMNINMKISAALLKYFNKDYEYIIICNIIRHLHSPFDIMSMTRTTHHRIKIVSSIIEYEKYFAHKYLRAHHRYKFDDINDKVRFKLFVLIKRKYEEMCGEEYGKNMSRQNEKNLKRLSLYVYTKFVH